MILLTSRWRFKFLANITFFPSKSHPFALVHHLVSPVKCSTDRKPEKSPFKASSNQEQPRQSAKTTFLSPQLVLTTLQNCPSDLVALSFFLWCARKQNYFHDKPAFRHMVGVVSNLTHKYGSVRGILEELESIGCETQAQTLLLLMRVYWRAAMHDMVFEAFAAMCGYGYVPNTYVRNIIVDVLFKIGSVDAALRFLKETQAPNFLSFNIAVCNLCRLNEVDKVKGVLRCMLSRGYYMNLETYALVLNCFCKFGRLEEASQLLGMMVVVGAPVSVNVWSILIDGYCKSGWIEVAAYILEKMVAIGCSPNIVTCTSLIKAFLESRMPGKAFEILDTLESKGCFPDLVLCNVLIDCLSKMGCYEGAFEVFSSLRDLRLQPDVYTYSSLVTTICLSRQYVLLPLLTSGLSIEPDLVVSNCLLSYFCKSGYPEGAIEFYDDMIDRGFLPDKYSFAGVLNALCRLGRIHEAVNVYHGIIRSYPGIDAHIHTIVINALAKSGSFDKAMKLFRRAMTEKFPLDAISYSVAIDGLIRDGRMEEAYCMFSQMKEMKVVPNQHTYNMILSGFCKDGDIHVVKYVLKEMIDAKITMDYHAFKLMKKLICDDSPNSDLADLFLELRNLGLLPKEDQELLVNGHDASAYANFCSPNGYLNAMDLGISSSDELPDALISMG